MMINLAKAEKSSSVHECRGPLLGMVVGLSFLRQELGDLRQEEKDSLEGEVR